MTRAAAAVALFPDCCAPAPHGWSKDVIRVRAESPRQSIFLLLVNPRASARFRCACVKAAQLLQPHKQARACIRCSTEDRQKSRPSHGSWYVLRSACGLTQLKHANGGSD